MSQAPNIQIARYELKYAVHPLQLSRLSQRIEMYCKPDTNAAGNIYTIHSLYFDSADFRSYRDAEASLSKRYKIRVRSYGSPGAPLKLEVKRRDGELVLKSSAMIDRDIWDSKRLAGWDVLAPRNEHRFAEFRKYLDLIRATPKMLIAYDRRAFTSRIDDYVRVTFDFKMRCQRVSTLDIDGEARRWRFLDDPVSQGEAQSSYLMELKFVDAAPGWLHELVAEFGLRRQGFSKYGRSVRRYIFGRESTWDLQPSPTVVGFRPKPFQAPSQPGWLWRRA